MLNLLYFFNQHKLKQGSWSSFKSLAISSFFNFFKILCFEFCATLFNFFFQFNWDLIWELFHNLSLRKEMIISLKKTQPNKPLLVVLHTSLQQRRQDLLRSKLISPFGFYQGWWMGAPQRASQETLPGGTHCPCSFCGCTRFEREKKAWLLKQPDQSEAVLWRHTFLQSLLPEQHSCKVTFL